MSIIIRRPLDGDLTSVINLGKMMHGEGRYAHIPWDDATVYALAHHAIRSPQYFIRLAELKDEIVGFMLGYYAPYFFNNKESIASDLALFVEPTKRGGFVASKLIDAFIQWAKFKQCFEIVLGTTTGVNTNRVESFYEKKGFIKVGGLFKRGIK